MTHEQQKIKENATGAPEREGDPLKWKEVL